MKIVIINGPNLNLLGTREPEIYGSTTFEEFYETLIKEFAQVDFEFFQSNVEGELINKLQEVGFSVDGILLNAGGYTHTSVAIGDTIAAITTPVMEVHISNPQAREKFRHKSFLTKYCIGVIAGLGLDSYRIAVEQLIKEH